MQQVKKQVSCAVASSSPGTHNSTFALEAPASFPCQQHPQLPCSARGCCCTLRLRLDLVSAAEVFPHPLPGPSRKCGRRSSSRLVWSFSVPLLAVLSQTELVPVPGTEQCGDTEVAVAGWAGTSITASSAAVQSCSPRMPIASLCLFSLHLSPLQSLLLCLLVLASFCLKSFLLCCSPWGPLCSLRSSPVPEALCIHLPGAGHAAGRAREERAAGK